MMESPPGNSLYKRLRIVVQVFPVPWSFLNGERVCHGSAMDKSARQPVTPSYIRPGLSQSLGMGSDKIDAETFSRETGGSVRLYQRSRSFLRKYTELEEIRK